MSTRETRQNSKLGWTPEAQAAIMDYPILGTIRRSKDVLTVTRILDALSEADRILAITKLKKRDQDVLAALAEKPPMPGREMKLRGDDELARLIESIERRSTTRATRKPSRFRIVN